MIADRCQRWVDDLERLSREVKEVEEDRISDLFTKIHFALKETNSAIAMSSQADDNYLIPYAASLDKQTSYIRSVIADADFVLIGIQCLARKILDE